MEPLPPLGTNQGGLLSGNVELVVSKGRLFVLAEAIKYGVKGCSLQVFNALSWEWEFLTHVGCEYEALLEMEGSIFILGRSLSADGHWLPQLVRYDHRKEEACKAQDCVVLQSPPTSRCYIGAGALDGCIYAVGGYAANVARAANTQALAVAEKFDPTAPADDAWSTLPSMNAARFLCKVIGLKGALYVLGGVNNSAIETALEHFDPVSKTWSSLKPMECSKGAVGVTECNGQILVFGGTDPNGAKQPEVESFDPVANRWRKLPNIGSQSTVLGSTALVGAPGNMLAVFSDLCSTSNDLVIQHYNDPHSADAASHIPSHKGRQVRVAMMRDIE